MESRAQLAPIYSIFKQKFFNDTLNTRFSPLRAYWQHRRQAINFYLISNLFQQKQINLDMIDTNLDIIYKS